VALDVDVEHFCVYEFILQKTLYLFLFLQNFFAKNMVFKDSAREFVLLELSNALLSSLHSSSFSSLTSSSLSSRERRASSLDFVAHTGARNRTALESLFFLFVVSLCVLKTRKSTRTRTTTETKRRSICVADEEDGKEESAVTPTTRENNGEEGGEGDENTSSFCGEVLSSDDDEDDNEEEEELDEELEDVHRKWEIVARYPCVLHRVERTKNDANDNDKTSSLLDAWMRAVPRKGKRKLKAVGFGRDIGNGLLKDLAECNFRVEEFRCAGGSAGKTDDEEGNGSDKREKRRRVGIDEEDDDAEQ
tara:strand:+ start:603 stop:1517 length:915 start_codon:yes stop_codon:yes gene_type:complete